MELLPYSALLAMRSVPNLKNFWGAFLLIEDICYLLIIALTLMNLPQLYVSDYMSNASIAIDIRNKTLFMTEKLNIFIRKSVFKLTVRHTHSKH